MRRVACLRLPTIEVSLDCSRVERRAVLERGALADVERPGLAVGAGFPALGQGWLDAGRSAVASHEPFEDLLGPGLQSVLIGGSVVSTISNVSTLVGDAEVGSKEALLTLAMFVNLPVASSATSAANCSCVAAPPLNVLVDVQITTRPSSDAQ